MTEAYRHAFADMGGIRIPTQENVIVPHSLLDISPYGAQMNVVDWIVSSKDGTQLINISAGSISVWDAEYNDRNTNTGVLHGVNWVITNRQSWWLIDPVSKTITVVDPRGNQAWYVYLNSPGNNDLDAAKAKVNELNNLLASTFGGVTPYYHVDSRGTEWIRIATYTNTVIPKHLLLGQGIDWEIAAAGTVVIMNTAGESIYLGEIKGIGNGVYIESGIDYAIIDYYGYWPKLTGTSRTVDVWDTVGNHAWHVFTNSPYYSSNPLGDAQAMVQELRNLLASTFGGVVPSTQEYLTKAPIASAGSGILALGILALGALGLVALLSSKKKKRTHG